MLIWHVHGSWTESFVAGGHRCLIPVDDQRDECGRGLLGRHWPQAREVPLRQLSTHDVDLVVLQRPLEIDLTARHLGRRPGVDIPAVYVGTDLLPALSAHAPIDVWGMGTTQLNEDSRIPRAVTGRGDVSGARVLDEVSRRRVFCTPRVGRRWVLTEWPQFRDLDWAAVADQAPGAVVVDTRNLLDRDVVEAAGLHYLGNGRADGF
ncbi:putative UDP-glucose 6-dehydrogenase [Mycolicibacterium chubuense NBB4]|uniref:Putative UDP-glucose 6-dehydrogenase n=1 Tax=Mycolicibacterium chubuense (strain NBB4) TaxID=710421 RepID=I4BJL1_MYCCN|nr:putative UDP-glucose 6-dehydrogenase [Mycolicibacterium chubuense NBB4]